MIYDPKFMVHNTIRQLNLLYIWYLTYVGMRLRESHNSVRNCNLDRNRATVIIYWYDNSDRVNNVTSYYALMLWNTIINAFPLASPPCHRRCRHHPPHDICIPSPSFLCQIESCHPLLPIPTAYCVFLGGVGRGAKLRPPSQKPPFVNFWWSFVCRPLFPM